VNRSILIGARIFLRRCRRTEPACGGRRRRRL